LNSDLTRRTTALLSIIQHYSYKFPTKAPTTRYIRPFKSQILHYLFLLYLREMSIMDEMSNIKTENVENMKTKNCEVIEMPEDEGNKEGKKITQSEASVLGLNKSDSSICKKKKTYTILDKEPLMLSGTIAHILEIGVENMEEDYLEEIKLLDPRNRKWRTQRRRIKTFNISKYLIG